MIAVVLVSSSETSFLVGLAATLAAAVLVAHWGAYRPQVKRLIAASLIALALATTAPVVFAEGEDTGLVIVNPCVLWEPWSWPWILMGCMLP